MTLVEATPQRNSWSNRIAWLATLIAVLMIIRHLLQNQNGHLEWYGRDDIYAVSMLAALPIGFVGAMKVNQKSRSSAIVLGGCLLLASLCLAVISHGTSLNSLLAVTSARALLAFLAAFSAANLCLSIAPIEYPDCPARNDSEADAHLEGQGSNAVLPTWTWLLFGAATIAIPATYTHSVEESLEKSLTESLGSKRITLAWEQCWQLRRFNPTATAANMDLATLESSLHNERARLEEQVRRPIPRNMTMAMLGKRITSLVQLDRNHEALGWIRPMMSGRNFHPISLDYYGLCQQRLDNPDESMRGYERSLQHWERQLDSPSKRNAMVSAYKGIAFAARQSGNRRLEEEAYRSLVESNPTAEHHFLLATCYKEHQKTSLAAESAQLAARLDPLYAEQARSMLSQLSRDHFSCFLVPR